MHWLLRPVGQALLFGGKVCAVLLVLVLTLGAIGVSQRFILFSESCGEESPAEGYWLCVERASLKTYLANDTAYQQGGGEASTPSLEAARAVDPDLTGATSLANAVTICRTGTATCADAVRIAFYCDAGNICRIEFYDASNALLTEAKAVYSGSSWLISIDNAGTQATCMTMTDAGVITYAALESCGQLAGITRLTSQAADPADTGWARLGNAETLCWESSPAGTDNCLTVDSSEQLTFGGSPVGGSGDITAVGTCTTGACTLVDADIPNDLTVASTTAIDTTSTLTGLFKRVALASSPQTLTQAAHCGGSVVENTSGAAITINLPAAVEGCRICILGTSAHVVTVDMGEANDVPTLCQNGTCTALTAGNKVTSAATNGAMACFMGRSATSWYVFNSGMGDWADGGA